MQSNLDFSDLDELFGASTPTANNDVVSQKQEMAKEKNVTVEPAPVSITPVNAPLNPALLQSAQVKMQNIMHEMNALFVERETLIHLMLLAITTGNNLLMLGPPGTAKSAITEELCRRIENANYFQWLLNKTSDPSEIFGSFSIREMENDRYMRVTTGKLPEAHISFLDECYKSNAPTLNALLTIMNEHVFYNDGKPQPVPLISLFGASNEPPEDETLLALHDRFIFRMNVEYVHDPANKKRMHSTFIDRRAGLLGLASKTTITLEEVKSLQQAACNVKVSKDIINRFIRLISDLERQAIHVSDRRQNECFKVMQGSAVLAGRNNVGLDDFKSLIYVLWEKEEQIPIIESAILKMVNPFDDKFNAIVKSFKQIKEDNDKITDPSQKAKATLESKGIIEKLVTKTNKLINEATKNGKDVANFVSFREEMVQYNQDCLSSFMGSFGGFNTTNTVTSDGTADDGDLTPFI